MSKTELSLNCIEVFLLYSQFLLWEMHKTSNTKGVMQYNGTTNCSLQSDYPVESTSLKYSSFEKKTQHLPEIRMY